MGCLQSSTVAPEQPQIRRQSGQDQHFSQIKTKETSYVDFQWLKPQFHRNDPKKIIKPEELELQLKEAPAVSPDLLNRIAGSMIGSALGDALGAHVEFRPYQYMLEHPVKDLQSGGTWGLEAGQFTDDTSMSLCLAISLLVSHGWNSYDQLLRYKWWYRNGYMSSTGTCFDIGEATRKAVVEFENRQRALAEKFKIPIAKIDSLEDLNILAEFDEQCGKKDAAGNGSLMRLAPVPLFFHRLPAKAVAYSGESSMTTHGDRKAYDACRYYGALIVAALGGESKKRLLDRNFYKDHQDWFGGTPLVDEVRAVAEGSFKQKNGHDDGIRGKGFVIESLKAALWAFWSDNDSFEQGVLAAINLGDDTDTTAAIYGQLAGAHYGYNALPDRWKKRVYAEKFIRCLSKWIGYEGERWAQNQQMKTVTTVMRFHESNV